MLAPSEIELLRQDLKAALEVIGDDEIEDVEALLRSNDFSPGEFEIIQRGDPTPAFPAAITGVVVVVRTSSGAAKTYDAGHNSTWLLQFEGDLKAGVFGRSR